MVNGDDLFVYLLPGCQTGPPHTDTGTRIDTVETTANATNSETKIRK